MHRLSRVNRRSRKGARFAVHEGAIALRGWSLIAFFLKSVGIIMLCERERGPSVAPPATPAVLLASDPGSHRKSRERVGQLAGRAHSCVRV